jgi:hypothetical protein
VSWKKEITRWYEKVCVYWLETRRTGAKGLLGELWYFVKRFAVSLAVSAEHSVLVSGEHFTFTGQLHSLVQGFALNSGF